MHIVMRVSEEEEYLEMSYDERDLEGGRKGMEISRNFFIKIFLKKFKF